MGSLRDDLVLSTTTLPTQAGNFELTKLERLLKDDPQMEWYYDYATGQLHNGIGWNYNLKDDKLENDGQGGETLDHNNALGKTTKEIDDGSNAAFVAAVGKDNQFNKGTDATKAKNIFYDPDTRQLTTFFNGIHYHLSLPIDPHHEGPKVGTFLQWLPFGTSVTSPDHEPDHNGKPAELRIATTTQLSEVTCLSKIDEKIKKLWQIKNNI